MNRSISKMFSGFLSIKKNKSIQYQIKDKILNIFTALHTYIYVTYVKSGSSFFHLLNFDTKQILENFYFFGWSELNHIDLYV